MFFFREKNNKMLLTHIINQKKRKTIYTNQNLVEVNCTCTPLKCIRTITQRNSDTNILCRKVASFRFQIFSSNFLGAI